MEVPICLEEAFVKFDDLANRQMLARRFIKPPDGLNKLVRDLVRSKVEAPMNECSALAH